MKLQEKRKDNETRIRAAKRIAAKIHQWELKNVARGWKQISGDALIRAVKEAGVPYDGMVQNGTTWIPRWVYDAIQTFEKNEGYAELTMVEFLKKLK